MSCRYNGDGWLKNLPSEDLQQQLLARSAADLKLIGLLTSTIEQWNCIIKGGDLKAAAAGTGQGGGSAAQTLPKRMQDAVRTERLKKVR